MAMTKEQLAALTDPTRVPEVDDGYGDWPATAEDAAAAALSKLGLPEDLVSLVYHCAECGQKSTIGRDYMVHAGRLPERCPCGELFDQERRREIR